MYSKPRLALKYIAYYSSAANSKGHGMHSPFVYDFIKNVLNDERKCAAYEKVEGLRSRLLADHSILEIQDFGAGSAVGSSNRRSVASIARSAAKPAKFGQLIYRMVQYYMPKTIIELGTSLGITGAYLALANPQASVVTLEGAPAVVMAAKKNFEELHIDNVKVVKGNFDQTLPGVLEGLSSLDFCFIDGNHRQEPTERYFQQLLPHINNDTILIFDDIHWSRDMELAWKAICSHSSVKCTIDLFFIGIVLFRSEFREKQHFKIRY